MIKKNMSQKNIIKIHVMYNELNKTTQYLYHI